MRELRIISAIAFLAFVSTGCYYDVEEELYPSTECVTADMSYAQDVVPILTADCYGCHSTGANFGNVTLEGYDQIMKYVEDGSLVGSIRHASGFSPMPKGRAQLLDCEIEKIEAWIADGALNN